MISNAIAPEHCALVDDTRENDMECFDALPLRARQIITWAPIQYSGMAALETLEEYGEEVLIQSLLDTIAQQFPGWTAI